MSSKTIPAFEILPTESYLTIKLQGPLEHDSAKLFMTSLPDLVHPIALDTIVNCESVSNITQPWMRALMQMNTKLKGANKKLRLLGVPEAVHETFKREGVSGSLIIAPNLKSILTEFGVLKTKALDVNFINPFLSSALAVLSAQCSTQAKAGLPVKKTNSEKISGEISGVIGLLSENFSGFVVISFPETTFLKVASRLMKQEHKTLSKEIEGRAGEICNMIFNQAKAALEENGHRFKAAPPAVVKGANHSLLQSSKGARVVIPFETDAGALFIEICMAA